MFYVYAGNQQIYKPLDDLLVLFNPKLTLELGKAGSLEFDIPPVNPFYDNLNQLSTEVSVDIDNDEIFHGRVLSNERMFNNVRHIYCEGDLSYLVDSVQKGVRYSGTTHELFRRIIANHNARMEASKRFTVGTIGIENRSITLVGQSESEDLNTGNVDYEQIAIDSIVDEWNNTLDYIQTCLIDYCGGYLRTRRVNGVTYIDLLDNFQNRAIQPIELGSNLLDLTEEVGAEDVYTVLIPLGDDNLTIASVNGGSDELVDTNAVARFGRIIKTHVFNNVSSASTLLENAQRFLASTVNVPRTISVRAVDLHFLNPLVSPIRIGDRVTINSSAHDVDDELTCTRIEYDLERPENNNYIFGNPKQSLTQRYREDARLSNDTYGNSAAMTPTGATAAAAASPAKAASSAASAASAAADKVAEKALNDFYDAWVDFDPDQATVSLGALSRQYYDGKEVLMSQCGIDLDGKTGNINVQSLHNVVDDHGNLIAANEAHINVVQTDLGVAIEQSTARHSELEGVVIDNNTAINQRCDDLSATIELNAQSVREFEDSTTTALANITTTTNDHEARIASNTRFITNVNGTMEQNYTSITQRANAMEASISSVAGRVDEHGISLATITQTVNAHETSIGLVAEKATANGKNIASIQAWANDKETVIELKADKTYVKGLLDAEAARLDKLMAGNSTATKLLANTITADSINLKVGSGTSPVVSKVHSHNITAKEDDSGTITISIGSANTDTIPQTASFDIAKTKKYTAGVAAVNVKTVEAMSYSSTGDFTAELIDSYVRYSNEQIVGRVRVTLDNNNQKNIVVKMAGNRAFTAGKESVTVSTLGYNKANSSDPGWTYDTNSKKYTIKIKAVLSSGKNPKETNLTLDASQQITAAIDSVTVSTLGYNKANAYDPGWTYDTNTKKYTVKLKAVLSSGKNPKETTIDLDASQQIAAATDDVTVLTLGYNKSNAYDPGWTYDSTNKRYTVKLKATLSSGKNPKETTIDLDASSQINAAINTGATSAAVSTITVGSLGSASYDYEDGHYYSDLSVTATASGTKADGSYYTSSSTKTKSVNVDSLVVDDLGRSTYWGDQAAGIWKITLYAYDTNGNTIKQKDVSIQDIVDAASGSGGSSYYYWSDEKSGPYGSRQRDCCFVIGDSIVHVAKVIWSPSYPSPSFE